MQKQSAVVVSLLAWVISTAALLAQGAVSREPSSTTQNVYHRWSHGPSSDPGFFPIAVWLQNPANAPRYKAAGINLYVGLWRGPTAEQLALVDKAEVSVICRQNEVALNHPNPKTIVGWMHNDEPDNAQSLGQGKGYGPPISAEVIERDYQKVRQRDPARPVFLNLGQGAAWDQWIGRGVRRNHPEDYPAYLRGCDIVSFDIYPAVHDHPDVAGKLEFVAKGVERLVQWGGPGKIVWNCIESARIDNPLVKPSPEQIRAEVWMSLIHGSRGLIYFVHQFKPVFKEAALLDDPELLPAVTEINRQIRELAPVLNSPTVVGETTLQTTPAEALVASMMKRSGNTTYLFAVNMRNRPAQTRFAIRDMAGPGRAEVLGESREVPHRDGQWTDDFKPYQVHLYRITK